MAREAAETGAEVVVAAGGDGTVCAVVNGLMQAGAKAALAILPLGTGNDFARTLAMPMDDIDLALEVIQAGRRRPMDVVQVTCGGRSSYFINMATGGFSSDVSAAVTEEMKKRWGAFSYISQTLAHAGEMKPYHVRIKLDEGEWETYDAFNVLIANGRTVGGGVAVVPEANPEDGLLDVVVVLDGSLLGLITLATQMVRGRHLQNEQIVYHRAREVRVRSSPLFNFTADGDPLSREETLFHIQPKALPLIVGPEYQPDVPVE